MKYADFKQHVREVMGPWVEFTVLDHDGVRVTSLDARFEVHGKAIQACRTRADVESLVRHEVARR